MNIANIESNFNNNNINNISFTDDKLNLNTKEQESIVNKACEDLNIQTLTEKDTLRDLTDHDKQIISKIFKFYF